MSSRGKVTPKVEIVNEKMITETVASTASLKITEYCPEWAYPEGGIKVLVAGPWSDSTEQYTVLFDNFPVPSILVQNGLLRCFCPGNSCLVTHSLTVK